MTNLASIKRTLARKTRIALLETLPKNAVVAELGVFAGEFSRQILSVCKPRRLYLVDLFRGDIISGDASGNQMKSVDMGKMRFDLEVEFVEKPVTITAADTVTWLINLGEGVLDWCYLDSDHSYHHVCGELLGARHAVKEGGWICGHDYDIMQFPGVVQAVDQFVMKFGLELEIYCGDGLASYKIHNTGKTKEDLRNINKTFPN